MFWLIWDISQHHRIMVQQLLWCKDLKKVNVFSWFSYFCLFQIEFSQCLRQEGGGPGVKKNKFSLYQSPTCHGVTTFYRISKSLFMTKIWHIKVWGYCSVPYKIYGLKWPKTAILDQYFQKYLSFSVKT